MAASRTMRWPPLHQLYINMGGFDRRLTKLSGKCQPDFYDNKRVIDPLTKLDLFSVNLPKFPLRERGLRKKGSLLSTGA